MVDLQTVQSKRLGLPEKLISMNCKFQDPVKNLSE